MACAACAPALVLAPPTDLAPPAGLGPPPDLESSAARTPRGTAAPNAEANMPSVTAEPALWSTSRRLAQGRWLREPFAAVCVLRNADMKQPPHDAVTAQDCSSMFAATTQFGAY